MGRRFAWLIAFAAAGCLRSTVERCDDGALCPPGKVCADGPVPCVLQEQLDECEGHAEGEACAYSAGSGACRNGSCVEFSCGDGVTMPPEQCDQADLAGADCGMLGFYGGGALGCNLDCTLDTAACTGGICGDQIVNGPEPCEPGVTPDADCIDSDFYEAGPVSCNASCRFDVSDCSGFCGDEILNGGESCDEGIPLVESCLTYTFGYGWIDCRACVPYLQDCHQLGWHVIPVEDTGVVRSIHGTSRSDVWAVGDGGLVLHYQGSRFAVSPVPIDDDWKAVYAASPDEVYLAGDGGTILRWDGASWTVSFSDTAWSFDALWSAGPGHALAGGSQGLVAWNGSTWSPVPGAGGDIIAIWGVGGDDYHVIEASGRLSHHTAAGWQQLFATGVRTIWGRASDDIFIGTDAGVARHWNGVTWNSLISAVAGVRAITGADNGTYWLGDNNLSLHVDPTNYYWSQLAPPATFLGDVYTGWEATTGELFAGGTGGVFGFDGTTPFLITYSPTPSEPLTGLWAYDKGTVFAAAGDVYQLINGSNSATTLTGRNLRAVSGFSATDVFAVGDAGAIWRLVNTTWGRLTTPPQTPNLHAVHGYANSDVWAVGDGGWILRFTGSWQQETSPTTENLRGVWAASASLAFAVGDNGTILRWNGTSWSVVPPVNGRGLRAVYGFGPDDVIAVGEGGTALRFDGTDWTAVPTATSVRLNSVWGRAPDDVFAVGEIATVIHDDGYGFTPVRITNSQNEISSVSGAVDEVHFGGVPVSGQRGLIRFSPWKRRSASE